MEVPRPYVVFKENQCINGVLCFSKGEHYDIIGITGNHYAVAKGSMYYSLIPMDYNGIEVFKV